LETLRDFLSWLGGQMNSPVFAGIAGELPLYRMLIFGLALVVMMVLRPRGLVSGRTPSVALGEKREIPAEIVAEGRA
jgi:branched-chain amino acid transport system permease protein